MTKIITRDWGHDLFGDLDVNGLESLTALQVTMGKATDGLPSYFNPVNISIEHGVHYISLYACCLENHTELAQRLSIYLASLLETDVIRLSVSANYSPIQLGNLLTVMSALGNTPASVEILLDQMVIDSLGYFYLIASKVIPGYAGALMIPSYVINRSEDVSAPSKAIHDFYQWVVDLSVENGRLTQEEADKLHAGEDVLIPNDRFTEVSA